jgi:rhomboid family GlyGly-CTERM serine protease
MNQYHPRQWALIAAIILLSCMLQMLPENIQSYFRYDQMAVEEGQLWRLITGHLLHLSWYHLISNLAALVLVFILLSSQLRAIWLGYSITCIALLCSAGLFVFSTYVKWYVGLSGVIHGVVVLGCALAISQGERWAIFLTVGTVIKLVLEQAGVAIGSDPARLGGDIIVDAHLWGALAGISVALPLIIIPGTRERPVAD